MPVGSVLAKESINLSGKKKMARPGQLLIVTKLEAGSIPETNDWLFAGLQPNGKVMKIKRSFCDYCRETYEDPDYLVYPVEEACLIQDQ